MVALFWLFGAALFVAPFLGEPSAPDREGEDPGRRLSELDWPFDENVAELERAFETELGPSIAEASEAWFGQESIALRQDELVELNRLAAGRQAYERYCVGCHGTSGDGAGPAARHLEPRPRNFRKGVFKFTSTPTGRPPLRRDIFQTLTRGLSGSSMPEFHLVPDERRWDLVEYVRYLAIRGEFEELMVAVAWDDDEVPDPELMAQIVMDRWDPHTLKAEPPPIPESPRTPESIARGREVYLDTTSANCASCHGPEGEGDGPVAGDFLDYWGYPIRPRDLTRGVLRAGSEPADVYRSIATGINGTPMPSFGGQIPPQDIWALVHYIQSLNER